MEWRRRNEWNVGGDSENLVKIGKWWDRLQLVTEREMVQARGVDKKLLSSQECDSGCEMGNLCVELS